MARKLLRQPKLAHIKAQTNASTGSVSPATPVSSCKGARRGSENEMKRGTAHVPMANGQTTRDVWLSLALGGF